MENTNKPLSSLKIKYCATQLCQSSKYLVLRMFAANVKEVLVARNMTNLLVC